MPKTIEITSHMPRLHIVGAGHGPAVKDGDTVKPGPKHGKLTIKPGSNDIDAATWEQVRGLPVIKHYLGKGKDEGLIEGETSESDGGLADMRPGEAARKVKDTLDLAKLREWEAAETRPPVLGEIKAKIKKLEAQRLSAEQSEGK
jgi:hypothetical protein